MYAVCNEISTDPELEPFLHPASMYSIPALGQQLWFELDVAENIKATTCSLKFHALSPCGYPVCSQMKS